MTEPPEHLFWEFDPSDIPISDPASVVFSSPDALSEALIEFQRFRLTPAGILLKAVMDQTQALHSAIILPLMVDSQIVALLDTKSKVILQFLHLLRQEGFGLEGIIQDRLKELQDDAANPKIS